MTKVLLFPLYSEDTDAWRYSSPRQKVVKWQVNLGFKFKSKFIIQGYLLPLLTLTCNFEGFNQD